MKPLKFFPLSFLFFSLFSRASDHPDPVSCNEALASSFTSLVSDWIVGASIPSYYSGSIGEMSRKLEEQLKTVVGREARKRNFKNTIMAADEALDTFAARGVTLMTVAQLVPADAAKSAEVEAFSKAFSQGLTRFGSDSDLYAAIKETPTKNSKENELKAALLRRLEENGATRSPETRARLAQLSGELATLTARYRNAIQNDSTLVELQGNELAGLGPESLKNVGTDGVLRIPVGEPASITDFLKQSTNEEARRKVYLAYRGRLPENMERLRQITRIHAEVAQLLGKASFLDKAVGPRSLAGGPAQVQALLEQLAAGFKRATAQRMDALRDLKRRDGPNSPLQIWDIYHYENQLLGKASAAEISVEEYYPAGSFTGPFFATLKQMFQFEFTEVTDQPVWHESVKLYRVTDLRQQKTLGYMYMDLYSRPGKNPSTAFVEELVSRRQLSKGKQRVPIMVYVTNWGPYENRDSIRLGIDEVQTALHEMGHALHGLIQEGDAYAISGWSHPTDMMEVPSITLDRMVKEPEMLVELSALHGDPTQKMPMSLAVEVANQQKGFRLLEGDFYSSSHEFNTVFLSMFDQEIQRQGPQLENAEDILRIYREMFTDFFGLEAAPEDHFPQSFHHIAGEYAGSYASYIVAGVNAANNIEKLKELGGILNPEAISVWRERALSVPQYEKTASRIQEEFWGHPVSVEPIFQELNLPKE